MASHAFTVKESLSYGWETFKKNWKFLVVAFIIIAVAGMIPSRLHDWASENMPNIAFLFTIIGYLVQLITGIGALVIALKIVEGKKPEYTDIYNHYNLLLNYFLGSLLYGVVVIVGIILLVVPGIIWGIKYQYTTYLIIDKKMSPMDAFKKSGKMTEGHKMKLFLLGLAFIAITLVGMMLFRLGLIVSWPIVLLSSVYVYKKLLAS